MNTAKFILLFVFSFSTIFIFANNSEYEIESALQAIDPSCVPIFNEATIALNKDNLFLADSLYRIVYNKIPSFDPVIRILGIIQSQLGDVESGIALCKEAVSINRSAYNLYALATAYSYKKNDKDFDTAIDLLKEAQKLPNGDDPDITTLLAQIALQRDRVDDFRSATHLLQEHGDLMVTHYFSAILAAIDEDWKLADKEIHKAGQLGLSEEAVNHFLDSGVSSHINKQHWMQYSLWIIGIWIVGLFLLFEVGKILSNITLKSIESQTLFTDSDNSSKKIRPIYKFFMNFGGIYYYLSLPIVIILVIAFVVALFYLFLYIGRIPAKLMFFLAIGACVTIFGMIKSLLVKVNFSDPGWQLLREEAPELYKLTEEVASTVGTRPIDEIRITPATDLAVYERGSRREKFQDKAERILILGIGVLKDFNRSDFCAVLAHEYGHFSNRDTAGGEIALRVRNDMRKYFYALCAAGQNVEWNVAFQFLRLYDFIFRRISHGATRLQEVLADHVAAKTYGNAAFQNGLTYVIKRDIEFNKYVRQEIEEAQDHHRPFNNLYELSGDLSDSIETELQMAINQETTEDDTHPSPNDRFHYIANVNDSNINYDTSKIKDLFINWDEITAAMTEVVEKRYK
ncbi:MAG: M48 family metalloprotease [Candidatus Azobacteroides sp.]|nr:M48 family metalloprotease [Candidatus Azobacteroides sp.]